MTTVIVALDDFTLRVESDAPEAPAWMLNVGEMQQRELRRHRPQIEQAFADLAIFGHARFPMMLRPLE